MGTCKKHHLPYKMQLSIILGHRHESHKTFCRAPEGSSIKSKMMYASTKDFLKGFLDGVGAELQVRGP